MIHAHEILNLLRGKDGVFTKNSLNEAVIESFGSAALFTNCSGMSHNFVGIFQFFLDREKILVNKDQTLSLIVHNVCG